MWERLEELARRYEEINEEMARPDVATNYERVQTLAKERARLDDVVALYNAYKDTVRQLEDAQSMLADTTDAELRALAREEIDSLDEKRGHLEEQLKIALLPKDERDEKDIIVEIRAAAGGEESALFAAELYRMYSRYAERHNWQVEVLSTNETGIGGFKEIIFEIRGRGAYSRLKYESGSHRVQRVPATEASGRIHTSTATVAVLAEAEDVDVKIDDNELRVDIFHAGGHGGQNVNKVATAVRITHLPTGIVVVCQDERSQLKNRTKAMSVLRARLLDMERSKQESEIAGERRSQVGTGERAEKIRTYNFPQDRVTDHRIGLTVHNLPGVLDGELDEIIDALISQGQAQLLVTG